MRVILRILQEASASLREDDQYKSLDQL